MYFYHWFGVRKKKQSGPRTTSGAARHAEHDTVSHPHRRLPAEIRDHASLTLLPAKKFSNNTREREREREREKVHSFNIDCNKELNAQDVT